MRKRSIITNKDSKSQPVVSEKPLEQIVDTLNGVIL